MSVSWWYTVNDWSEL